MINNVEDNSRRTTLLASLLLMVFTAICIVLVFQYVANEKQRDIQHWQQQLGIIAESQKRNVEDWLQAAEKPLERLAKNPLVQIYLTETTGDQSAEKTEAQLGQLHHLKNLLNATARNAAVFTPVQAVSNNQVQKINDGLALMNRSNILLATRYFPQVDSQLGMVVSQALANKRLSISNIYLNDSGQPRLVIAVPVHTVQAAATADYQGVVVAVINPERSLSAMLSQHWLTNSSDESMLVMPEENGIRVFAPLRERGERFFRKSVDDKQSAIVYGALNPGGFAMKKDAGNQDVLVTSRSILNTRWLLLQKIDAEEALQESISHQKFILIILLLAVFVIAVSFIAIWRHATSLRLQKTTQNLAARTELLNAVTDSIRDFIFLLDANNTLVMINRSLAEFLDVLPEDVKGRHLNHLYNAETVEALLATGEQGDVRNKELRLVINDRRYDYHVSVVQLRDGNYRQSKLYLLHDITALKDSQYRHNRLLESIIRTIVRLTDIHDPHCENHSERTREVAVAIAEAMGLARAQLDALAMAAQLANIGKLCVPAELLVSDGKLTDEQAAALRKSNQYSVELLQGLDFEGPVLDIVRQKNEYLDGSGYPQGLSGDEILLESRILAVANAFVAISSARAYRAGKPANEALDILFEQVDKHYDRKVVSTLMYVVEKHEQWKHWQHGTN